MFTDVQMWWVKQLFRGSKPIQLHRKGRNYLWKCVHACKYMHYVIKSTPFKLLNLRPKYPIIFVIFIYIFIFIYFSNLHFTWKKRVNNILKSFKNVEKSPYDAAMWVTSDELKICKILLLTSFTESIGPIWV